MSISGSRYGGRSRRESDLLAEERKQPHILSPNPLLGYRRLPKRVMLKKDEPVVREGANDVVKKWERNKRNSYELSTPVTGPTTATSSMGLTEPSPERSAFSSSDERGLNQQLDIISEGPSPSTSPSPSPSTSPSSRTSSTVKHFVEQQSQPLVEISEPNSDLRRVREAATECVVSPSSIVQTDSRDADEKQENSIVDETTMMSVLISQEDSKAVAHSADVFEANDENSSTATSATREELDVTIRTPPDQMDEISFKSPLVDEEDDVTWAATTATREDTAVIGSGAPPHLFLSSPADVLDDGNSWTATTAPGEDSVVIGTGVPPGGVLFSPVEVSLGDTPADEDADDELSCAATSASRDYSPLVIRAEAPSASPSPDHEMNLIRSNDEKESVSEESSFSSRLRSDSQLSSDFVSDVTSEPVQEDDRRVSSEAPPGFGEIKFIPSNTGVVTYSPSSSSSYLSSSVQGDYETSDEDVPQSLVIGLASPLSTSFPEFDSCEIEVDQNGVSIDSSAGGGLMFTRKSSSRRSKYKVWGGDDFRGMEILFLQNIEPSRLLFESCVHVQNGNPVAALFTAMNAAILYSCGSQKDESQPLVLIMSVMETLHAMRTNRTSPTPTLSLIAPILKVVWSLGRNL